MTQSLRWIGIGMLLASGALHAFQPSPPSFQFVSVRKLPPAPCPPLEICIGNAVPSRDPGTMNVLPGARFEARNQTIENLARVAFGFDQVDPALGVVAETKYSSPLADRFDVTAGGEGEWSSPLIGRTVPTELRTMLRGLLEQRFKLKARVEPRKVDVWALALVDPARGPGPALRPASDDCVGPYTDRTADDTRPKCQFRLERLLVEGSGITLTDLATMLYSADHTRFDRLIIDRTGLQGHFDVRLAIDAPGPSRLGALSQALKRQLGLKLVKTTLQTPTLVIEHAEAPRD